MICSTFKCIYIAFAWSIFPNHYRFTVQNIPTQKWSSYIIEQGSMAKVTKLFLSSLIHFLFTTLRIQGLCISWNNIDRVIGGETKSSLLTMLPKTCISHIDHIVVYVKIICMQRQESFCFFLTIFFICIWIQGNVYFLFQGDALSVLHYVLI